MRCELAGYEAVIIDWVNHKTHDLSDYAFFLKLMADIRTGVYCAAIIATPCETFSAARTRLDGETFGPIALRGPDKPDLYGYSWLTGKDKETCRLGTLLAVRSAEIAAAFGDQWLPWILENPYPLGTSAPSVFRLDELAALASRPWCELIRADQCCDGADCTKPTGLLGWSSVLRNFGRRCTHSPVWWRYFDGEWVKAPHAPLRRKGHTSGKPCPRPVLAKLWHPSLPSSAPFYATHEKKACPGPFNKRMVEALVLACDISASSGPTGTSVLSKQFLSIDDPDGIFEQSVVKPASLRGHSRETNKEQRERENDHAIGGMRSPSRAVARNPKASRVGAALSKVLQALLLANLAQLSMVNDLGTDRCSGFHTEFVEEARQQCASVLGFPYWRGEGAAQHASLRPDFIGVFVSMGGDPEKDLAGWTIDGCPLGIRSELKPSGIFPPVHHREIEAAEAEHIQNDVGTFSNYASLEDWPDAAAEQIDRLAGHGFV